jgi:hypothetical protein
VHGWGSQKRIAALGETSAQRTNVVLLQIGIADDPVA